MRRTVTLYKPFDWQKSVHRGIRSAGFKSGCIHVVKSKRQIGKTEIIINELLRFSCMFSGSVNCNLSPTLSQSRKVYRDVCKYLKGTGLEQSHNDTLLEVTLINGSLIMFKSAEQGDNLRGFTITGILTIDEGAYIPDSVFYTIKATTDVHKAIVLIVSTPRLRSGFFYTYYQYGLSGEFPLVKSYDLTLFDTSRLLSAEMLETYRVMMPKSQFTTEYLGEFLDTESIIFGDFKRCIGSPSYEGGEVFWGIDWSTGSGNDDTALAGFDSKGNQIKLLYFNGKSTTATISAIKTEITRYPCGGILAEDNSVGTPMCELLQKALPPGYTVTKWNTNATSKNKLVKSLQVALEQNKITLIDDPKQTQELSVYEAKYNPKTGNVSYNAPTGLHDDICIADMLANQLREDRTERVMYCVR